MPIVALADFTLSGALTDAVSVITQIVNVVEGNVIIAAAFTLGVLIPAGAKAFKKIAKIGK